jgi:hypothetical protein
MLWKCGDRVRFAAVVWCAAIAAIAAAGCGKKEAKDPYVPGTLRGVTRGEVRSKGFLFEIPTPEFVFTSGNTAIVRDKNLLEILVLPDVENRAASLSGKVLGVEKRFDPFVHLVGRRVKDGMTITPLDTVPEPVLPRIIPPSNIDLAAIPGFDLKELNWNGDPEKLNDRVESQFQTVGRVMYRENPEVAGVAKLGMSPTDSLPPEPMAWFLAPAEGGDSLLKISNVTPQLEFALRMLEAENLPFVGACTLKEVYSIKMRKETKVTGKMEIGWLRFANRYLGA